MDEQTQRAAGGRFIAGDPLRAVAALSVFGFHLAGVTLAQRMPTPGGADIAFPLRYGDVAGSVFSFLHFGLFIFFALSGYLISRPFVRAFVAGDRPPAIRPYLRNRFLRIVPAFWLVFTVALVVTGPLGSSIFQVGAVYGFMEQFHESAMWLIIGQSWTLHVELGYYLLVPLAAVAATAWVGRRLGARGRLRFVAAATLAVGIGSVAARELEPASLSYQHSIPPMLCFFVPGILLAIAEIPLESRARGSAGARTAGVAMVVLAIPLLAYWDHVSVRQAWVGLAVACGGGMLVAGPLVYQWATGGAWRLLDNRVMHWLGERSYSIYLIHLVVLYQVRSLAREGPSLGTGFLLMLAASAPIVIVASHLSRRYFELPFLRLRKGWRRGRDDRPTPRPVLQEASETARPAP
jgi:acetyltransferase